MKLIISKQKLFFNLLIINFLVLFIISNKLYSQENENGEWFSKDRLLPYDSIPSNTFLDAVNHQWEKRQNQGFGLSPQLSTWSSIGPSNDYRNGRVVRVKYDPIDANIVYICAHNGGVWRSDNAQDPPSSVVFNFKTMDLQTQSAGDVAIDPQNHNTIYYGTGGKVYNYVFNYYGIGVYKSTDAGQTWNGPYRTGFLRNHIQTFKIAVNPANSNHVYLACGTDPFYFPPNGDGGGGLYKSTDGGMNWAIAPGTPPNKACNDVFLPRKSGHIVKGGLIN